MRTSGWTPSIVPGWADQTVYIAENDFGRAGRAFVETDGEYADLEATVAGLLQGQVSSPIRVIAFNTAERLSQDVSEDIAHELRRRCDLQLRDVPSPIQDFVERHKAPAARAAAGLSDGLPAKETCSPRHQGRTLLASSNPRSPHWSTKSPAASGRMNESARACAILLHRQSQARKAARRQDDHS